MELLLNLVWLLLALPAFWLWRGARAGYKVSSLQCLLCLGCVLVMLFPVISATDDLHVTQCEMEESPASKRSVRQAAHDKVSTWNSRWQSPPTILPAVLLLARTDERAGLALNTSFAVPGSFSALTAGRAPPELA